MPTQLAGQSGRGGPLGDAPEDQQDLRGATVGLVEFRAGEGVEDPATGIAAIVDDRGAVAAMDPESITDPATGADETAGVKDGDESGVTGVFVQLFRHRKVHDNAPGSRTAVSLWNYSQG
jgi:hypothetical protein